MKQRRQIFRTLGLVFLGSQCLLLHADASANIGASIPPRTAETAIEYVEPFHGYPKLYSLLRAIFGPADLAPSHGDLPILDLDLNYNKISNSLIWSLSTYNYLPEVPLCQEDCLILENNPVEIVLYRRPKPGYEILFDQMEQRDSRERCEEEVPPSLVGLCAEDVGTFFSRWSSDNLEDDAPQEFWIDSFEGASYRWDYMASDNAAARNVLSFAERMVGRPLPEVCEDKTWGDAQTIISACGVFRSIGAEGGYDIAYCLEQSVPEHTSEPIFCFPLFRRSGGTWMYAAIMGQIYDRAWGGGAVSECTFNAPISNERQARVLASALRPLIGRDLTVRPGKRGEFLIGGSQLNASVAAVNRRRPWAYLAIGIRLMPEDTGSMALINANYSVSAQRLTARRDGRDTNEEEAQRINALLLSLMRQAIARTGANEISCAEEFDQLF